MYFIRTSLLLLLMLPACLQGQQTISLQEAVTVALANNPTLQVLAYDRQLSQNSIDPSMAGLGPRINLNGSLNLGYGDSRVETINLGPPGSENPPIALDGVRRGVFVGPEANWLIFDGGAAQARLEQLRRQDAATALQIEAAQEGVVAEVTASYLNLLQLIRQREVAEENLVISNERLARIRKTASFGQANELMELRAQTNVNTDSVSLATLGVEIRQLQRNLVFLIGLPSETEILPLDESVSSAVLPDFAALEGLLVENNEEIALTEQRIKLSEQAMKITRLADQPKVQLYLGVSYLNQNDESNFLQENRSIIGEAGVRFSYTLFDGGARKIKQQNASIELDQATSQKATSLLRLKTALRNAYDYYENSRLLLRYESNNIATFEAAFERSQKAYAYGQLTSTEVREAQLALSAAKSRMVQLEYAVYLAETELLRLTGQLVQ